MSRFAHPAAVLAATASLLAASHVLVFLDASSGAGGQEAPARQAPPGQLPTYKGGVDLVRVDAYVVDRDGRPVPGLAPKDFQVTVDGKPRKVVSADFVKLTTPRAAAGEGGPVGPGVRPGPAIRAGGGSEQHPAGRHACGRPAAQRFLKQLSPDDQVSLLVIPAGGDSRFTTDHASVARRLEVLGGAAASFRSEVIAQVSITEVVEAGERTADACTTGGRVPPMLLEILDRNGCLLTTMGESERNSCCLQIVTEIHSQASTIQQATSQSLMALESLFLDLARFEGRKTVILFSQRLVTGGAGSLDRGNDLRHAGRLAGRANTNLYVLHLSKGLFENIEVDIRLGAAMPFADEGAARDGLEQIAGAAGGALFQVLAGADFAFERIARETSAFYLLGLEPLPDDRDGKPHQIRVRTGLSGATVRARTEFAIPIAAAAPAQEAAQPAPGTQPATAAQPTPAKVAGRPHR